MQLVRGMNTSRRRWYYREIEAKAWRTSNDWPWFHKVGLARFYADLDTKTRSDWIEEFLGNLQATPDDARFATTVDGVHVVVDVDRYSRNAYGFTIQGVSNWVGAGKAVPPPIEYIVGDSCWERFRDTTNLHPALVSLWALPHPIEPIISIIFWELHYLPRFCPYVRKFPWRRRTLLDM